jgi:glycosyltransferase involved in cell wall biosynthesis
VVLLRILHLDFGPEWRGGQRQALTLHQGLLHRGVESCLLTVEESPIPEIARQQGVGQIARLPSSRWARILGIRRAAKAMAADIIHFHDALSLSLIRYLPQRYGFVETRRVSYPIKLSSRWWKYRPVDAHVGVSDEISEYLRQYFRDVTTVPSCIDLQRFAAVTDHVMRSPPFDRLLFVGALSKQKGLDILLMAMPAVAQRFPTVELHIVGAGALREEMESLTHQLNLGDCVHFHGARTDVEDFYQRSHIVVVPSVDGEGSNGVIKEAMAAGKVVIASDLKSNRDLFDNGRSGFFFRSQDHLALSQLLQKVVSEENRLDPQLIRARAAAYSPEQMIDSYLDVYRRVCRSAAD